MAILGTLLASSLIASSRLTAQAARAEARVRACQMADRLLEGLWQDREKLAQEQSGEVAEAKGWRWRTIACRGGDDKALRQVSARRMALELTAPGQEQPAVRVEFLAPSGGPASQEAP